MPRLPNPEAPPYAAYIANESRFVEGHRAELFDPISGQPTALFLELKARVEAGGHRVVPARLWKRRLAEVYAEIKAEQQQS